MKNLNRPGNDGQVAYKSGSEIRVILTQPVNINLDLFPLKNCPSASTPEAYWYNCIVENDDLDDYFKNTSTANWAIWLMIFFLMGYFLITVFQDEEMDMYYHENNHWSLHPVYSIRHHRSEFFTKRQRMASLFMEIILMSMYLAFLNYYEGDKDLAIRLTLYPLTAPLIVIPVVYIAAFFLNRYYLTYSNFCDDLSQTSIHEEQIRFQERWEKDSY